MSGRGKRRTSADHAIALMAEGARANGSDPFRAGLLVELPARGEVLVAGDFHGNEANLRRVIELANLPRFRERHLVIHELVHEIEVPTELCRSYRLVETAARLKAAFPAQAHILLGNHEFAELLDLPIGKQGRELNVSFGAGLERVYGGRWEEVKAAYCGFWRSCALAAVTANGVFICHSTPRLEKMGEMGLEYLRRTAPAEALVRRGPAFALLWGRDYRPEAARAFAERVGAEVLLVGHTPCENGMEVPNGRHVILDCKDRQGRYVLLPLDRPLTQEAVVGAVRRLYG